jgi:hypothetical protein
MTPTAGPDLPGLDVARLVRHAADDVPVDAAPTAAIARRGLRRRRRQRTMTAVGAVALVVAVPAVVLGVTRSGAQDAVTPVPAASSPVPPMSDGCTGPVPERLVPEWARTGFSEPEPREPLVLGERGDIVAILFGGTLHAPPAADRNNKILWVSRVSGAGSLVIDATLVGGTETARREVEGGPGPSYADLPRAGCWQLRLSWGGHVDTMRLRYEP